MRTAWLLAALLTVAVPAFATKPPKVQWLKTFPGLGTSAGYWVRQTADGGFIAAGVTALDTIGAPGYYYVLRLDSEGDTLWTQTFNRASSGHVGAAIAYGVVETMDGGFAVFGDDQGDDYCYQPHLIKLDSAGQLQWHATHVVDTFEYGSSLQQTADGGYILAGMNLRSSTYLMKVDSTGTRQWCWTLKESYRATWPSFVPVAVAADGGYVTAGLNDSFGLTLWKVNDSGKTAWRRTYADEYVSDGYSIVRTKPDEGFVIMGHAGGPDSATANRIYLLKVDTAGNKQWCRYFDSRRDWRRCSSVWQTSDGGFVMTGVVGNLNEGVFREDAFVLRADQNGNELWYTTLSPSTEDDGECVQQTSDGGYVVCGGMVNQDEGYLYLLKLAPERKSKVR
jgi:hypothetical protein